MAEEDVGTLEKVQTAVRKVDYWEGKEKRNRGIENWLDRDRQQVRRRRHAGVFLERKALERLTGTAG